MSGEALTHRGHQYGRIDPKCLLAMVNITQRERPVRDFYSYYVAQRSGAQTKRQARGELYSMSW
jgi:hypothetical protein